MSTRSNEKVKRILSALIAIVLVAGMIPIASMLNAYAAIVPTFTVEVDPGIDGAISVTLTNDRDASETATEVLTEGFATFISFVDSDNTYHLEITGMIGYEDYHETDITFDGERLSYTAADFTPMEQIHVSGQLFHEDSSPFMEGGTISFEGYTSGSFHLSSNGTFSTQVYKDEPYIFSFAPYDPKYMNPVSLGAVHSLEDVQLNATIPIKTYSIATSISGGVGTITDTESGIKHGSDRTIEAIADPDYRIASFTVDGNEIHDAKDRPSYAYPFYYIQENHEVAVTFYRKTWALTFHFNANGTLEDGSSTPISSGGIITAMGGSSPSFLATANEHYHISSVVIDSVTQTDGDFDNAQTTYAHTFSNICADHTITVTFAPDQYDVTISSIGNGSVSPSGTQRIEHNGTLALTLTPDDGYNLTEILLDGVPVDDYDFVDDGSAYTYTLSLITSPHTIQARFDAIPDLPGDEFIYYRVLCVNLNGDPADYPLILDGQQAYLFLNENASITFSPKEPYAMIRINGITAGFTKKFTHSVLITRIEVFRFSPPNKGWQNVPIATGAIQVIIDTSAPVLEHIPSMEWTNQSYTVAGTVTDENTIENPSSGLDRVVWSKTSLSKEEVLAERKHTAPIVNGAYSFTISDEQDNETYYVYAIDRAQNVSDPQTVILKIDKTKPEITGFTFQKIQPPVVPEAINFLDYGTHYHEDIEVIISASDAGISSGLKEISLYSDDKLVESQKVSGSSAKFRLTLADFNNRVISASVTDVAGNESAGRTKPTEVTTNAASNRIILNATKPTIFIVPSEEKFLWGSEKWYDDNVLFTIIVNNEDVGIHSVQIKINGKDIVTDASGKQIDANFSETVTTQEIFTVSTGPYAAEGENHIEVIVHSNCNSKETVLSKVYIDTINPEIIEFTITKKNGDVLSKILNFLTFGVFFNEEIKVTVIADDKGTGTSGVQTITLYADGIPISGSPKSVVANGDGTFRTEFILPETDLIDDAKLVDVVLSAVATDYVTNITGKDADNPLGVPVEATTANSNLKSSRLMIETGKPTIDIASSQAPFTDDSGTKWYADNSSFTVTVEDLDSGIRSVQIKLNDDEILTDIEGKAVDAHFYLSQTHQESFIIDTTQGTRAPDGSYTIDVTVIDNAGNEYSTSDVVYVDIDAPYIACFEFLATGTQEADGADIGVYAKDYGFYFSEDTMITISAQDDEPTSTIQSITYYTVDASSGQSSETTVEVIDDQISFVIPANFKGQIYAKATDRVNNTTETFVAPHSTIIESPQKHAQEKHIFFHKAATAYNDNKGFDLYADDVDVSITVCDTYSGLRKVEWSVTAPYDKDNNQSGHVEINNDKTFKHGASNGWNQTQSDSNLVTEMTKTITVKNNSNEIVVWVKITDRAGNVTEDEMTFSIDKTAPKIDVSYNNNSVDGGKYFKEERTATIVITECNFNPDDVIISITNTGGTSPVHVGLDAWNTTYAYNAANPHATTHTATIQYSADGDYTFNISYKDRAQNANSAVDYKDSAQPTEFTIDKTPPTISISYDNNNTLNDKFFAEYRTATIHIHERNFDVDRVQFTQTAEISGTKINIPDTTWQHGGDIHTATIKYAADGDYTFHVTVTDMAGNGDTGANFGSSVAGTEFTIDTTCAGIVVVEGIANGEIFGLTDTGIDPDAEILITFDDINFDFYKITLSRSRVLMDKNNISVPVIETDIDVTDLFVRNPTGEKNTVESIRIPKTTDSISNDGLYELRIEAKDKAGNAYDSSSNVIVFSVNRFGSVYTFNPALVDLAKDGGAYTKAVTDDLIITEYNPNALNNSNVEITRDASPLSNIQLKNNVLSTEKHTSKKAWYEYTYEIEASNFAEDGVYKISVSSEDSALNNSETLTYDPLCVEFRVDTTPPEITNITGLEKAIINGSSQDISFNVFDAIGLKKVTVYVNGTEFKSFENFSNRTNFTGAFTIGERSNQKIRIVVEDMAGNITDTEEKNTNGKFLFSPEFGFVRDITVSTNFFVRYYANKPLFWGSIFLFVLLIVGLILFLLLKKKKRADRY